ncbi:MAG TPA: ABC transporter permease [Patescibacteria group bacterium]|nr:ABC transporter permease [Patescibacteria group bacterium]
MNIKQRSMPGFGAISWSGLIFLYAPIAILILFSFNSGPLITVWQGFGTNWYSSAWNNEDLRRAMVNSLVIASGAMLFSTFIALPAAIAMHGRTFKGQGTANTLLALPLLVPEMVMAIASLSFFTLIGLNLGIGNVMIAHVVFCIPFAYSPIRARLETIPAPLGEAAADLYADPRQIFIHITLPLLMPGIISGAMLAFITSLDDFIITQMVAPPGAMTLPVYIYSMVRKGITPEINAISSLLLVVSMGFVIASVIFNRKGQS